MSLASTETVAAAHAVKFAQDCGYKNAIFEEDAIEIINLVKSPAISLKSYSHIIYDIKRDLLSFGLCNWSFVRCNNNMIVHCLAKQVKFVSDVVSWMEEAPKFLLPPLLFYSCQLC